MICKLISILLLLNLGPAEVGATVSTCSCSLVSIVKKPVTKTIRLVDLSFPQDDPPSAITALNKCEVACRLAQADFLDFQGLEETTLARLDISQSKPSSDKV